MVFASISFLFYFLPVFLAAYFLTPTVVGKNLVTLIFSLAFYTWGEPRQILVLLGFIAFNTFAGICIDWQEGARRTLGLAITVTVNLLVLAIFKYGIFIVENLNAIIQVFGISLPVPPIRLPLGISFFTFHCLSYIIDVYRRKFPANRSPLQVAVYIAMFPQLIAGPIVRYKSVARQLQMRRHTLGRASVGARIFVIGLAQKVLIADQVARLAEVLFDQPQRPSMAEAWSGLLAYTLQIYFDFAGYSNMAIGLGLIIGFTLPRNFRMPYTSLSITDFWRRWHISLSTWFRDYLYIPLGGNRSGPVATYRNLIIIFMLCGLWHGASWTFVLWGAYHGAFLVIERIILLRLMSNLPTVARSAYALLAVMLGWVLFRSADLGAAGQIYAGLIGLNGIGDIEEMRGLEASPFLLVGSVIAVLPRWSAVLTPSRPVAVFADGAWTLALLVVAMSRVAASSDSPFLYFRF